MSYFIKTGFWKEAAKGPKEWLNLNLVLSSVFQKLQNIAAPITDGTTISVTEIKQTLETSESAITVSIDYTGDDSTIELILNATSSILTFSATTLCVSEGVASGDNTLSLSGVSGDKYIIGIKKIGTNYYIVSKNFGQ